MYRGSSGNWVAVGVLSILEFHVDIFNSDSFAATDSLNSHVEHMPRMVGRRLWECPICILLNQSRLCINRNGDGRSSPKVLWVEYPEGVHSCWQMRKSGSFVTPLGANIQYVSRTSTLFNEKN
jgi:hypothetical protein